MNRKEALRAISVSAAMLPFTTSFSEISPSKKTFKASGKINHSVCKWCFPNHSTDELAEYAARIGMGSVELLGPEEWPVVIKHGLTCAMGYGSSLGLTTGFNDPSLHDQLLKDYKVSIPLAEEHGIPQVICFPGNRNGKTDKEGLENCARGIEPVAKLAEKHNIILSMELMNSKINHPDYQADSTQWAVDLVDKVGSPNFKILYDIYHMQVQEGNVIATIRKYKDYISHFHTAGVPGRHELDEDQELQYPAIMRAIADSGFTGFVGHEFIPTQKNPLQSLEQAVKVCSV